MHLDANLADQVREIMGSTFDVDEGELPPGVNQESFPPWTSLSHVTLLLALEDHFGVRLTVDDMQKMTSLPNILAILSQHGVGGML